MWSKRTGNDGPKLETSHLQGRSKPRLSEREKLLRVAGRLNGNGSDAEPLRLILNPLVNAGWDWKKVWESNPGSLAQLWLLPLDKWGSTTKAISLLFNCRNRNRRRRLRRRGEVSRLLVDAVASRRRRDLRRCRGRIWQERKNDPLRITRPCGRYFVSSDPRKIYCSGACSRRASAERWRSSHAPNPGSFVARAERINNRLEGLLLEEEKNQRLLKALACEKYKKLRATAATVVAGMKQPMKKKIASILAQECIGIARSMRDAETARATRVDEARQHIAVSRELIRRWRAVAASDVRVDGLQ